MALTTVPITVALSWEGKGLHIQSGQGTLREPVGHDLKGRCPLRSQRVMAGPGCKRHPSICALQGTFKHNCISAWL
ncbi:hypothetical protein I79_002225 [Cricetulus griseus]|uniref:Uncharacterized protein n=1 Tax=Cricetulus griseus TaxID=10029 RepID=G3GWU2_CRIGR|nr:hypothetical protein I79_002225 [Cricetulus griseus]